MSSDRASHKSTSTKPNTNTNNQISSPEDQPVNPQHEEQAGYPFNASVMENPAATERPGDKSDSGEQSE
jgi:hypothetical protein